MLISRFKPCTAAAITALAAACLSSSAQAQQVEIATPLGNIYVELDPTAAPNTVANFLTYINDGDYTDSFIHRNATTAKDGVNVIQGGGFTIADTGVVADQPNPGDFGGLTNFGVVSAVETNAPVANEFNQSNLRGTIAMARQGGLPDSATSQWFINVSDNVALDSIDGGFTVFGTVTTGMDVVDAIHGLNDETIGTPTNPEFFPLTDVPILNSAAPPSLETSEVVLTQVSVVQDNPLPEPSSAALLALGGLLLARRRRAA